MDTLEIIMPDELRLHFGDITVHVLILMNNVYFTNFNKTARFDDWWDVDRCIQEIKETREPFLSKHAYMIAYLICRYKRKEIS